MSLKNFKKVDSIPGEPNRFNKTAQREKAVQHDIRKILTHAGDWVPLKEIYRLMREKYRDFYANEKSYQGNIRSKVQSGLYVIKRSHESSNWYGQQSRRRNKMLSTTQCWILSHGIPGQGWRLLDPSKDFI